jgi:hypothetical protein
MDVDHPLCVVLEVEAADFSVLGWTRRSKNEDRETEGTWLSPKSVK